MNRQEDFEKAAYNNDRESSKTEQQFFIEGCGYGYQYAIDKTCEFFDSISCCEWVEDIEVKELVKKYKKFMNEQL